MSENQINDPIADLETRIRQLQQRGSGDSESNRELWQDLWEELHTAIEELTVTEEELRNQNEELQRMRLTLEQERQRYQSLFQFAPDGYLVTDLAGNIQEANLAASLMLNHKPAFLKGKPLVLFVDTEDRHTFHTHLNDLAKGRLRHIEEWDITLRPKDGTTLPSVLTVGLMDLHESGSTGLRWMLHNATLHRRAEAERKKAFRRLNLFHRLDRAVLSGESLAAIGEIALRFLWRMKTWHHFTILTFDWEKETAHYVGALNREGNLLDLGVAISLSAFQHLDSLRLGQLRVVEDVELLPDTGPLEKELVAGGIRSYVGIPLLARGELLGLLTVGRDAPASFESNDLEVESEVATHLAVAFLQTRLREELRRHTVKLEELVTQRTEAYRQERDLMTAVLDTAGALISVTSADGRIVRFNRACERLSGRSSAEVEGKAFWELSLVPPEEVPSLRHVFDALKQGRDLTNHENHWLTSDGEKRLISWSNTTLCDAEGNVEHIVGVGIDVTEQRRIELALQEKQSRLDGIISTAIDAIITIDSDRQIILFNDAAARIFGRDVSTVIGQPLSTLFPNSLRHDHTSRILRFAEMGTISDPAIEPDEMVGQRSDGTTFPIEIRASQVTISGQEFLTVILRDVSARKQAEQEREALIAELNRQREQLRQLAQQAIIAEEEERGRLSRELHDEAGQALTAMQYSLSSILSDLKVDDPSTERMGDGDDKSKYSLIRRRLRQAIALCETTMHQIRMMAHDLRPTTLDNVGLNLTLEGFCREFAERTRLSIDYAGGETKSVGSITEITLYRFLQEALTNVARHARADQVWVALNVNTSEVSLSVEDDGIGFDTSQLSDHSGNRRGIGLLGIRERLEPLQGWLEIDSTPGHGTLAIVHVPQKQSEEERHGVD